MGSLASHSDLSGNQGNSILTVQTGPDSQRIQSSESSKVASMGDLTRGKGQLTRQRICVNDRKDNRSGDLRMRDVVCYEG